ncbi:glycoside hydrolase domain-containing protein [Agriterribacter sp.]|uniref:glycoside hydrolase domain-containing protein n=1 Tax=Agriterribacter sp. TaxID=2821509 RepID=UPI002CE26C77|nr:glycoside hydrolase domain-containing protein [Agriterribacter sp.]HRO44778.1 DUF6067 family protein [Agriterribacter sp.]HRQ19447.1 DUF6067 family protein [Agriterribacter sp.]
MVKIKNVFLCILLFLSVSVYSQTGTGNYISPEVAAKQYTVLSKQSFYIFPETRDHPVKWNDSLQVSWLHNDYSKNNFVLQAQPGEYFVYQVGVWAIKTDLKNIQLSFSDLKTKNGKIISSRQVSCFNRGGIDYLGNPFTKKIDIQNGKVQPLWIGMDLSGITKGTYYGTATVSANNKAQTIKIQLEVDGEEVRDHGFNEGKRLSRMYWLNSTLGINDEVTKGYAPVTRNGNTLHILGRSVTIAANGLPQAIASYFTASNQSIAQKGEPILSEALRFVIEKENGDIIALQPGSLQFTAQAPGFIAWQVKNSSAECELICSGRLEFDGFVDYKLALKALQPLKIRDIRLEVPVNKEKAEYMMGLNREGGLRPASWQWQWDTAKNQDALWMGAVNGGLRLKLKAENYTLPLVNIYYAFSPLHLPPSWGNDNRGGVELSEKTNTVWVKAYSGNREMAKGSVLNYDFELLITPFRTISNEVKYGDRYFHGGGTDAFSKIEKAKKAGANIINIHHAENIYPFINYPYLDENTGELKTLVDKAHEEKQRLKLYYTTRELTKNIPEFQAFYSLNGEVLFPGPGNASRTEALHPKGPNEWLIKNLREKYIPAWYNIVKEGEFKGEMDLSVITTPNSRLNNFYIGGLDWMLRNLKIDGVYIDDAALDRFTLRRARKLIDQYRPEGRMDLHSWNHFNNWAGYASCLNLYMDLLPYFDLVWIGEGRDYNRLPDHWLVEVSGIPFGLPGQMLEGGGNPWRGMVYGITNRAGWTGNTPDELWKFWDQHSFKEKELTGYWDKACAVTTNNEHIKASVFKGKKESIIAIANWSKEDQVSSVIIDWQALGYDPSKCTISIPFVKDFQEEQPLQSLSSVNIPGKKGYMIVVKENN